MVVKSEFKKYYYNYSDFLSQISNTIEKLNNTNDTENCATPVYPVIIKDLPKNNYRNYGLVDFKYEKIKKQIEHFQNSLSDEYDVMVQMTTFGKEFIMAVEYIGYQNPDVLYLYGKINGQVAQLI